MPEVVKPISEWTREERKAALWKQGNLRFLCQPHQLADYDDFHVWLKARHTDAYKTKSRASGGHHDRIRVLEWSRRLGKTVLALILGIEECIRRPGAVGLLFTPIQGSIGDIVLKPLDEVFADAPEGYRPVYRQSSGGLNAGIHIDATKSFIRVLGLDRNEKKIRGGRLDFAIGTEAAFVEGAGLKEIVIGAMGPMFTDRPWSWMILESSTGISLDCEFNYFRDDAMLRDCYSTHTIEYHSKLTAREIDELLEEQGGRHSVRVQREFFCIVKPDNETRLVPAYDDMEHCIKGYSRPRHAICGVGMDPGVNPDPLGLVWAFLDYDHSPTRLVVVSAHQQKEFRTDLVNQLIREREAELWGTGHRTRETREPLMSIADAIANGAGQVWEPPQNSVTYYDQNNNSYRPNPYIRVSDIGKQQILDLRSIYGIDFVQAQKGKGSLDADLKLLNQRFTDGRIVVVENEQTKILRAQLRSGQWDKRRAEIARTPTLGHCDALSALLGLVRQLDPVWERSPHGPRHLDPDAPDMHVPRAERHRLKRGPQPLSQPAYLGGASSRGFR